MQKNYDDLHTFGFGNTFQKDKSNICLCETHCFLITTDENRFRHLKNVIGFNPANRLFYIKGQKFTFEEIKEQLKKEDPKMYKSYVNQFLKKQGRKQANLIQFLKKEV